MDANRSATCVYCVHAKFTLDALCGAQWSVVRIANPLFNLFTATFGMKGHHLTNDKLLETHFIQSCIGLNHICIGQIAFVKWDVQIFGRCWKGAPSWNKSCRRRQLGVVNWWYTTLKHGLIPFNNDQRFERLISWMQFGLYRCDLGLYSSV